MPKGIITIYILLFSHICFAQNALLIESYLNQVSKKASSYQIEALQEKSDQLSFDLNLTQFETTGSLGYNITDSQDPPLSPFSPSSTNRTEYSAGFSKEWLTGFKTSATYLVTNSLITFPGRDDVDFVSPDFGVTLETNLLRDLIYGRNRKLGQRLEIAKEQVGINAVIKKKQILIQSLLDLSLYLETKDELLLQESLCNQVNQQYKKLNEKFKRRSISKTSFLISKKDLNTCLAAQKTLKKNLADSKEKIRLEYSISESAYFKINIQQIFKELSRLYTTNYNSVAQADLVNRSELVTLRKGLEINRLRGKELAAEKMPDLNLSLTAGYKGIDPHFSQAQQNLYDSTYPYILGSLKIQFPFTNLESSVNASVNEYQRKILEKQKEQQERQIQSRFKTLVANLKQNFSIYDHYKSNVKLSKEILKEARKDFKNGRIDFFKLSDFQKSLIESQKQLATLRTQIISDSIEYFDYFHFFDRYY